MNEWFHLCNTEGRSLLLPHGEQCDRCGQDEERLVLSYDAMLASFERRYGYQPDFAAEEDVEDFSIYFAGAQDGASQLQGETPPRETGADVENRPEGVPASNGPDGKKKEPDGSVIAASAGGADGVSQTCGEADQSSNSTVGKGRANTEGGA